MRLTNTVLLGLTALVLAVVIHRVDENPSTGGRAAARANVLLRFDPAGAERLVIEKGPAKTVVSKQGGAWFLTEPAQDRADTGIVVALLDRLNHLDIADTVGEGEEGLESAQIGITGDRAIRVTVSGRTGEDGEEAFEESVTFGIEAPRTGSVYARREGGAPGTFVVDGNPRAWIENPLESLRDRRLLGAPVASIVQFVVRQASGQFALQRRLTPPQQDWALADPIVAWADREALDRLLTAIAALRIEEIAGDADVREAIPNPLPEGEAVFQFQVQGLENPLTLYLKQVAPGENGQASLLEARVSDRPSVYRLRSNLLESLPAGPNDLRDRTLDRLPGEFLDSIWIVSRIDPRVILKAERSDAGVSWSVSLNNKLVPANSAEVAALVAAVNEAAIQDFASDSGGDLAAFGLKPPSTQITFNLKYPGQTLADGSPGQVQDISRVLNLGWQDGQQRLFANFEGEPHVYELDPTFMNLIPTHPVKWKSLNVLTYNPMHLRSITRELPDRETLKLDYDYRADRWTASRSGVDVTGSLDISSARRLRDRLGSLTASGWYLSLGNAYEALQDPMARIRIVTMQFDPALGEARETTQELVFAPSAANFYFGQVVGSPDVFLLDHETFGDLIRPVTTARTANP